MLDGDLHGDLHHHRDVNISCVEFTLLVGFFYQQGTDRCEKRFLSSFASLFAQSFPVILHNPPTLPVSLPFSSSCIASLQLRSLTHLLFVLQGRRHWMSTALSRGVGKRSRLISVTSYPAPLFSHDSPVRRTGFTAREYFRKPQVSMNQETDLEALVLNTCAWHLSESSSGSQLRRDLADCRSTIFHGRRWESVPFLLSAGGFASPFLLNSPRRFPGTIFSHRWSRPSKNWRCKR